MANEIVDIRVTRERLQVPPYAFSPVAGAVVDFFGVVRERENDQPITGIDYEAHLEMARHQLDLIARAASVRFGLERLILHHRVGFVPAAEPSLFLRVCAPRRQAALDACRWVIEELKEKVPIWKHPIAQNAEIFQAPSTP